MDLFIALLAVVIGLIACFAGYRFFMFLLPIWGFFAGVWLGITGIQTIFSEGFLSGISGIIIGFILGIILALLSYLFYFVGVLILGGTIGYSLTSSILTNGFGLHTGFIVFLISLVVGLGFAILFIVLNAQKYLVVFITAFGGASVVVSGLLLLSNQISLNDISEAIGVFSPVSFSEGWLWWLVWLVMAVVGIITQTASTRKYRVDKPTTTRI